MRPIDADINVGDYTTVWECRCSEHGKQTVMAVDALYDLPVADVVEVVRCKDCRFSTGEPKCLYPDSIIRVPKDDDFCSYGKRR